MKINRRLTAFATLFISATALIYLAISKEFITPKEMFTLGAAAAGIGGGIIGTFNALKAGSKDDETDVEKVRAIISNLVERPASNGQPGNGEAKPKTLEEDVRFFIDYVVNGLTNELKNMKTSSLWNLSIGCFTSVIGMVILGWSLLADQGKISMTSDLIHFVPRVSFALFVEIFSFFFLRLYKRHLDDIKYLTNEITNVRMKLLALRASYIQQEGDNTGMILNELAKTERNFILKKGESTVEIEKMKIDSDEQNRLIENLAAIFKRGGEKK